MLKKWRYEMKYIYIVLLFVLTACASSSVVIDPGIANQIPKNSTKVIVSTNLPADSLYQKAYQTLALDGYSIKHSSDKMRQITTGKKEINSFVGSIMLNVLIIKDKTGSKAIYSGQWVDPNISNDLSTCKWTGMKGSPYQQSFAYMVKEADQLNGKLSFQ